MIRQAGSPPLPDRRAGRGLMLVFALLAAGIVTVGYLHYRNYERNYRSEAENQLAAIAELKVGELVQYRHERLGDTNILQCGPKGHDATHEEVTR